MRSDSMDAEQDAVLCSAIPHVEIDLDDSREDVSDQINAICEQSLHPKGGAMADQSEIKSIGGGITNKLYLLKNSALDQPVVVRRFGENTEIFIDRRVETSNTLQLNAYGFGAQLLASFNNGRLEKYLDVYTMTPSDMRHPLLVPKIAQRIAEYHACNIQHADRSPGLWPTISKWLDMARNLEFEDEGKSAAIAALDFEAMAVEVSEAQALCDSTHSPVVFCHNDLLSGNILLVGGSADRTVEEMADLPVQLIDFEYGCYSFRGFDWGNHFNEWAGFDCEWEHFPTPQQQANFLRAYLETGSVRSVSPEQVQMAVAEANAFALASHIYWGVWAILQAKFSVIDFDYITYSRMRWEEYHKNKAAVRTLVLACFAPPVGEPLKPFPPAFPEIPAEEIPVKAPSPTVPVMHGEIVEPVPMPAPDDVLK
eukprot:jgi/Ulvmu1/1123/UM106_0040.1